MKIFKKKKILFSGLAILSVSVITISSVISCSNAQPLRSPQINPTFTSPANEYDGYIAEALANWYKSGGVEQNNSVNIGSGQQSFSLSDALKEIVNTNGTITKKEALSELIWISNLILPNVSNPMTYTKGDITYSFTLNNDASVSSNDHINTIWNENSTNYYYLQNIGYDIVDLNNNFISFYVQYWGANSNTLVSFDF